MGAMPEDLDARLRRLRSSDDAGALIDLGCDLAEVGRHADAEWCFRRATGLDDMPAFELGTALLARQRWDGASAAFELALADGDGTAWRTLGSVLEERGEHAAALDAYRGAAY